MNPTKRESAKDRKEEKEEKNLVFPARNEEHRAIALMTIS